MIIRVISLSLALLIGISAIIPLTTNYTEANEKKPKNQKKISKRYKKYSKQWWRAYHNYVRQKRAKIARKRILRLRRIRIANNRNATIQPTGQKATNTAPNTQVSNLFILVEGKVKKVFIVLGEPKSSFFLAQKIHDRYGVEVSVPERGDIVELDMGE